MPDRAAFYVDGFNLYHAVQDLNEPFLKWCDLWKLGKLIIPQQSEELVKVAFCTAYYPGDQQKRWRHDQFRNALEISGVECIFGHYVMEPKSCHNCGNEWQKPSEKETDINVALSLMADGWHDVFDVAYLLTADSDQAATARMFKSEFPSKRLVTVAPPGRNFSANIVKFSHGRIGLTREHLEKCLFPPIVFKDGKAGRRPKEYDPPKGWVAPQDRPAA